MWRHRSEAMGHDPTDIKLGLQHIANGSQDNLEPKSWRARRYREAALDAMAYIRHLEGELRRAGFTEYNDQKETEE